MNEGAFDASFLDIATNTLAIVMIVTMFALITVKSETAVLHDPRLVEQPSLALRAQPVLPDLPFLDYYIVFDRGIVRWEQERYVDELMANGLGEFISLPGGKLRVSTVSEPRDPDSFTATFLPDYSALAAGALPITPENVEAIAADVVGRVNSVGRAPNFWVLPSGMDGFERLYRSLREEPIWLRWYVLPEDDPIRIERRAVHFARFDRRF